MTNILRAFVFVAIGAACSRFSTENRTPPGVPPLVPTSLCSQARAAVADLLKEDQNIFSVDVTFLADKSCAVSLTTFNNNALPSLKTLKDKFLVYGSVPTRGDSIPIWVQEARVIFVPVLDENMHPLSTVETVEECEQAAKVLTTEFPSAEPKVRVSERGDMNHCLCYVDLHFKTDADFESFFSWQNPHSFEHLRTQMHFERPSGVISAVLIRPVR